MTSLSYIRRGSFLFAQRYPHAEHIVVFSVDRAGANKQPRDFALEIQLRPFKIRDIERAVGIVQLSLEGERIFGRLPVDAVF